MQTTMKDWVRCFPGSAAAAAAGRAPLWGEAGVQLLLGVNPKGESPRAQGGGWQAMKMSSAVGPRGPRPPTVPPPMQELPDLSHLTEEERNIIMAVMDRQKEEEEKEEAMLK